MRGRRAKRFARSSKTEMFNDNVRSGRSNNRSVHGGRNSKAVYRVERASRPFEDTATVVRASAERARCPFHTRGPHTAPRGRADYTISNFPLDFRVCGVIQSKHLKALLFAGAQGSAGGLEFQRSKNG